jgi:hypothetical protein
MGEGGKTDFAGEDDDGVDGPGFFELQELLDDEAAKAACTSDSKVPEACLRHRR